jgi:hypothetical protein
LRNSAANTSDSSTGFSHAILLGQTEGHLDGIFERPQFVPNPPTLRPSLLAISASEALLSMDHSMWSISDCVHGSGLSRQSRSDAARLLIEHTNQFGGCSRIAFHAERSPPEPQTDVKT